MDVVIGLDVGTTATKAVAADAAGTIHAVAETSYPLVTEPPGRAELDPRLVTDAALHSLAEVARQVHGNHEVVGISVGVAMHALLPMTGAGAPLGPAVTWADDRAGHQARQLHSEGLSRGLHARTGTPVHPMSPLLKLRWWQQTHPDVCAGTPLWGGLKELLLARLTGRVVTELSSASGSGLLDLAARDWDEDALAAAGIRRDQLAPVVDTTEVVGPLLAEVATATGLPQVPVVAGAGDGPLANLGTGALTPGVAAVSLGTSGALRVVRATPAVDARRRLFCYALTGDLWVLGGAVNNAGSVLDWAGQAFAGARGAGAAELLAEAEQVQPWTHGLLALPYLLGERAPWWDPDLSGAVLGMRRHHGRGHLTRALVEGACLQLALVRDAVDHTGARVTRIRATGGALRSPVWSEALSAALGLPVEQAQAQSTGLGAALLGHHGLGRLPDLVPIGETVTSADSTADHAGRVMAEADDVAAAARLGVALTRIVEELRPLMYDLTADPGHRGAS